MNSELVKDILLVLAGGAVGSGVVALFAKRKINEINDTFEDRLNEELEEARLGWEESLRARYEASYELSSSDDEEEVDMEELARISNKIADNAKRARVKPDPISLARQVSERENYVSYSGKKEDPIPDKNEVIDDYEPLESMEDILIIAPQEYGEIADYEQEELFWLTRDHILVDDNGDPVEDVYGLIGRDALNDFGTWEPDAVYVRNNPKMTDYCVIMKDTTLANFNSQL